MIILDIFLDLFFKLHYVHVFSKVSRRKSQQNETMRVFLYLHHSCVILIKWQLYSYALSKPQVI